MSEQSNKQTAVPVDEQLAVIDVSPLFGTDEAARQQVGAAIHQACIESGFLLVKGHGIDPELQAQVFDQARQFFDQPESYKESLHKSRSQANRGYESLRGQTLEPGTPADLKEGFYIGRELPLEHPSVQAGKFNHGPNLWPNQAGFQPVMQRYFQEMTRLAETLMTGLALSLSLPSDYFDDFCTEPLTTLRLLHYPPQPVNADPRQQGAGAHTDFGGLTLLLQDQSGGLQVLNPKTETWIDAVPVPGTYVVNIGDMFARWTNDRYRSTLHRVVNKSGRDRYSIPFFYSGNPDHRVACLPNCLGEGETPRYAPTTVEAHYREMYRRTYAG